MLKNFVTVISHQSSVVFSKLEQITWSSYIWRIFVGFQRAESNGHLKHYFFATKGLYHTSSYNYILKSNVMPFTLRMTRYN